MNWVSEIRQKLGDRPPVALEPPAGIRRAGVVAPLFLREKELCVLFTKRSQSLVTHGGQVSFPGGAEEPGDESLKATALREAEEEIGLPRNRVVVLGRLSPVVVAGKFYVEPYVAAIPYPVDLKISADEIEEVWEIPIAALMSPAAAEKRMLPGRERPVLYYHYGSKTVWGATARILADLLQVLAVRPTRP